MSETTNRFSPGVRERAVRMVLEHEGQHGSRWSAIVSIASKIGCAARTLNEWGKKAEVESGRRAGVPTEMAERLKALERETRELRPGPQRSCAKRERVSCDGGTRPQVDAMVSFIDAHRGAHGVEPIGPALLPIAPSTCFDHLARPADPARLSDRARRDAA